MNSKEEMFGLALNHSSFKGRISPDFHEPSIIEKISACGLLFKDPDSQVLHNGRNRVAKLRFSSDKGQTISVVVKEFNVRGLDRLKTLFFPSKAFKAWKGGLVLLKEAVPTPDPVAYLEKKGAPFIRNSFYFSLFVSGAEEIRYLLRRLKDRELKNLIQSLARYLSLCHEKGIFHRDLSDGNILVRKGSNLEYSFFLIDTNRVRYKKRIGMLRKVKNLIRLGIPPSLQRFFLEEYFRSSQIGSFVWIWYKFNKKTYAGHILFKRKLRIRKVIEKLGVS
jgi:hypothetical protein